MQYLYYALLAVASYLLGCVSLSILMSKKMFGSDVRGMGSGNAGATNMARVFGLSAGVLTLIADAIKAAIAMFVGNLLFGELGICIAGIASLLGHCYPVFYGFKGGKGIATSLGMILVISPVLALSLLAVELVIVAVTRYMSLASISVTVAYPLLNIILFRGHENYGLFVFFSIVCGLLSLYCHRGNLMRLIRGEENRLDFKKISNLSRKLKGNKK